MRLISERSELSPALPEGEIVELPADPGREPPATRQPWHAAREVPYAIDRQDPTSIAGAWNALSGLD